MSKRRTFSPEFKQQAACLVLDQGYSHVEALMTANKIANLHAY